MGNWKYTPCHEMAHLYGAWWLSGRVLDWRSEGLLVCDSPEALHFVAEQDTLLSA